MLQVSHFSKFSETLLYKNKKISYLFKNNGGPPSLQPACKRKSPMLTELLSYQGTNGLDGLPARQKGNKNRGYPRLDQNILSYLKKRRLPTLPLCRQYHRRERA